MIRPSSICASRRQIDSPRPVPPYGAGRRVVELPEVFEDLLLIGRRDADAGVGDRRGRPCARAARARALIVTLP